MTPVQIDKVALQVLFPVRGHLKIDQPVIVPNVVDVVDGHRPVIVIPTGHEAHTHEAVNAHVPFGATIRYDTCLHVPLGSFV
jgi:hypothetical protein